MLINEISADTESTYTLNFIRGSITQIWTASKNCKPKLLSDFFLKENSHFMYTA